MSAEAWIALVALALPVIGGVVIGCVQFVLLRRDVTQIKSNDLPHILRALQSLPCREPALVKKGQTAKCSK